MTQEMVSCIIPTYKRSDTLLRAVKSVLNQTYRNLEVLIVDDNEPNDEYSLDIQARLKTLTDERVRFIQQERHINGAAARNAGIRAAQGEFVAFLDDDDEWLPNKIEKQIGYLKKHSEVQGVSCLYTIKKEDKMVRMCKPYSVDNIHKKVLDRSVSIFTTTILLRKEALDEAGYFDERLIRHQDLQLFLDFLYIHNMGVVQECLAILHADSEINHLEVDKMIKVKERFFNICERHILRYDRNVRKEIFAAHYFEIVLAAIKSKRIGIAIKYIMKIGFNFKAYGRVIARWRSRQYE